MPFRVPTRTVIRRGSLGELAGIAEQFAPGTALVVTDPGLSETPYPRRVCAQLEEAGLRPWVMADVSPNPRVAEVDEMAWSARRELPQVVVAVGGGSVIDAAKGVALLLTNQGSCRDYVGRNRAPRASAPLIAIPTTCGTGSEVTWVSVLSDQEQRTKISLKGDGMFPAWALVDSELIESLPADLIAATGLDAATHAIEAFIGKASNPASDQLAVSALRLIVGNLGGAVNGDADAQDAVMRGSTLAGMSFGNADVGAVHCLSEAIGGRHDLPHGLLNAVLLAPVLRHHGEAAELRLEELGALSGVGEVAFRVERLGAAVGIPAFRALGVPHDDFEAIAQEAERNGSNQSNPRPMAAADYRAILDAVTG